MKIQNIELIEVCVPARKGSVNSPSLDKPLHKLATGINTAWTRQFDEFSKFIVVATTDDGTTGLGETLRDPDIANLEAMSRRLIGVNLREVAWQSLPFAKTREYDAFELVILDLLGKRAGVPVATLLGGAFRNKVKVGAWSGHRTPEDAARIAAEAQDRGATTLKLKCELEDDVPAIAAAIREACGARFGIIFDPNERFEEFRHALHIATELDRVGNVVCLEDPLPRWDLDAYAELRARVRTPVALHVALGYYSHGQSVTDVTRTISARAADIFNFSSGIADFLRMAHVADAARRPYWHGSEIDLGIMEAGYVHVAAASAGCTMPSDIFGRQIRESDLLTQPLELVGDTVRLPSGPGLGVELDAAEVRKYELSRRVITDGVLDG